MALASYLADNGLTDAEFAEKLGVSNEAVRLWRHGARQMSPRTAKAVSGLTGIPLHQLRPDVWDPPKSRKPAPQAAE